MDRNGFADWLKAYGGAWESQDWEAVADLYSEDVRYYWTPFQEPQRGRQEIVEATKEATARQKDIRFRYEILAMTDAGGLARWWCSLTRAATGRRINLDGILLATFDSDGLCKEFREWWHSDEPADERPQLPGAKD